MQRWAGAREAFFTIWLVALLVGWLAPDEGAVWVVVQAVLAVAWFGCGLAWLGGWALARRRGDPGAQLDARIVLAFGFIAAAGIILAFDALTDSDGGILAGFILLTALAVAGYLFVAAHAPPPPVTPDDEPAEVRQPG